jgi:hypothetical protein
MSDSRIACRWKGPYLTSSMNIPQIQLPSIQSLFFSFQHDLYAQSTRPVAITDAIYPRYSTNSPTPTERLYQPPHTTIHSTNDDASATNTSIHIPFPELVSNTTREPRTIQITPKTSV